MAEERDPGVSRRYRELGAEEPSRALDEAIVAAARRELETRPAPLVAPTARRRWYVPLAAAAVIVLSVAVTLHVQREQPDVDGVSPAPEEEKPVLEQPATPKPASPAPPPPVRRDAPAAPPAMERRALGAASVDTVAKRLEEAAESPERMLERIARLRREGRDKEADELYAEFRRRFPGHVIPEALREQVLPR
jgi:hypothetical protein